MRNRTKLLALLGALALMLAACGDDEASGGDGAGGASDSITVTAADFAFDQTEISLEPGTEVELTLVNDDDAEHSFTSDDLGVEVEAEGGEEASTSFTAAEEGEYEFYCRYHPDQMKGTVVVGEGGGNGSSGGGGGSNESGEDDDFDY